VPERLLYIHEGAKQLTKNVEHPPSATPRGMETDPSGKLFVLPVVPTSRTQLAMKSEPRLLFLSSKRFITDFLRRALGVRFKPRIFDYSNPEHA
jgi:hypothetical protein